MIQHLELDLTGEPSVNGWGGHMDTQTEPRQRAFSLDARREPRTEERPVTAIDAMTGALRPQAPETPLP